MGSEKIFEVYQCVKNIRCIWSQNIYHTKLTRRNLDEFLNKLYDDPALQKLEKK